MHFELLQSFVNQFFFTCRRYIQFQRSGYTEQGAEALAFKGYKHFLESYYELNVFRPYLNQQTYLKNIETLDILHRCLLNYVLQDVVCILDAGAQDMARVFALHLFFKKHQAQSRIDALEIDAYRILRNFHSRYDKAVYYQSLLGVHGHFKAENFFEHTNVYDYVMCFYPFVSDHPALSWGLPLTYAKATDWILSLQRCVKPGRFALVLHQGAWEQEAFDAALREVSSCLQLCERHVVAPSEEGCAYISYVSIYQHA